MAWVTCMRRWKDLPIGVSCIPKHVCMSLPKISQECFNLSVIEVQLPFAVQQAGHLPLIVNDGHNAAQLPLKQ